MNLFRAISTDGHAIAACETGNAAGPAILFIHGFNQCHLSWARQLSDPGLASEFRMVALDLRGHGNSDQPADKASYAQDRIWADDVAAVIAAAGLARPVLVAWSYGGRIASDYLRVHGASKIGGINFVAAVTKSGSEFLGPALKSSGGMFSNDIATNIATTRTFARACFERQPPQDEFETMLGFNMAVPAKVRSALLDRTPNSGDMLAKIDVPVLVTHGAKDQLVLPAMSDFTAAQVKGARLSTYDGIGHAPFIEDTARFNRELAEFVRAASRR